MSLANLPQHSSSSSCKSSLDEEFDDDTEVDTDRSRKRCKEEDLGSIEQTQGSGSQVLVEENSKSSRKKDICAHPGSFEHMCIVCGQPVDDKFGVVFGYIHKGLRLQNYEVDRLRKIDLKRAMRHKKLYLVLDLDHTLLNSTKLDRMTAEEEYLKSQTADSLQDVSKGSLFKVDIVDRMIKLRPFVRTFLKETSEMFEMYIYTMGTRVYALEMAKLLDPRKEYFSDRVISCEDAIKRHQKGLDIVLGQENAVLILDDKEDAWTKHNSNLILIEKYHFFRSSSDKGGFKCKSLSELKSDESETEGALAAALDVLKQIHTTFFHELEDNQRDVRKGCKRVFSYVFPSKFQADAGSLEQASSDSIHSAVKLQTICCGKAT
ncbi:RNA polymerase II C-terminal domain phosphatase-like 4 [Pyrus ussuriensis x Pyrus communis]|uniref:RNA polymerase II C-terminal domain phosphatase-like n=1 Tax=Pyrus ussuriensis x Pyrus communis TaxID=2448454 RepID=A0A5N5HZ09_9ROSA|nr:RNA polymerase II C-terminal domain phosphatase-like 4 [Pyrus ussuriensis x Pyrus communis]